MTSTAPSMVTLTPLQTGSHLTSPFASSIIQAQQGGTSAQQLLQGLINDQYEVQGLVTALQGTPQWVTGTIGGLPASYLQIGTAFVGIAITETDPADAQKINLASATPSQTIHIAIGTNNASTYNKYIAWTVDATLTSAATYVFQTIVGAIIKRLQTAFTTFMQGAPAGENVNGQGEPNNNQQDQANDNIEGDGSLDIADYGNVQFDVQLDFAWVNRLTTIGTKFLTLIGWAAVFTIVYFIVEWLESIIFKSFNTQLNIYNVTTQSLSTTVQYYHNISGGTTGQTNQLILTPVNNTSNSPFSGFQPSDPLISYGNFTLTNDSELQGLGILMEISNVTSPAAVPPADPSLSNVLLTLDLPYNGSNSMTAWFNETSTDWNQLYSAQEGVNTGLSYQTTAGNYTVYYSTNTVSGAANEQYVVNVVIADTATYQNFQTYAGGQGATPAGEELSAVSPYPFKGELVRTA